MKVVVHVDGGARGNPGPAAAGAVVSTPEGDVLDEATEVIGIATNNVAEYRGLLLGLARAPALGASDVEVVNDSELVAKQVNGRLQGQAPGDATALPGGDGRAAGVRRVVDPLRAAGRRMPMRTRSSTRPWRRQQALKGKRPAGSEAHGACSTTMAG